MHRDVEANGTRMHVAEAGRLGRRPRCCSCTDFRTRSSRCSCSWWDRHRVVEPVAAAAGADARACEGALVDYFRPRVRRRPPRLQILRPSVLRPAAALGGDPIKNPTFPASARPRCCSCTPSRTQIALDSGARYATRWSSEPRRPPPTGAAVRRRDPALTRSSRIVDDLIANSRSSPPPLARSSSGD
jgi:hypothetical protein